MSRLTIKYILLKSWTVCLQTFSNFLGSQFWRHLAVGYCWADLQSLFGKPLWEVEVYSLYIQSSKFQQSIGAIWSGWHIGKKNLFCENRFELFCKINHQRVLRGNEIYILLNFLTCLDHTIYRPYRSKSSCQFLHWSDC